MNSIFKRMQGKASAGIQLAVVGLVLGVLAMTIFTPHGIKNAFADTTNYGPGTPTYVIPLHLSGTYSSSLSGVAAIKMPYKSRLIGFSGMSRAFGTGATPTPTVGLRVAGAQLLSTPLTLSTVAATEGVVGTASIADEATVFVDLTLTGVSSVIDTTLLMTVVR
jgi:hypothetical protein